MKKFLAGFVLFVLLFSLAVTPVFAAGHGRGRKSGTGSGTASGTSICAYCDRCQYDGTCPYNGDCPSDCPNNGVRPQDGTGTHHGSRRSSSHSTRHGRR